MSDNKMLRAYKYLLSSAKTNALNAEYKSWEKLKEGIDSIEEKGFELEELTSEELDQVRKDLKADIDLTANYLNDLEQGVNEFLEMDLPLLEKYLADKALSLADPTEITLLRIRMMAAMENKD